MSVSGQRVSAELLKLDPSALIELFEMDFSTIDPENTTKLYFHSGTNELTDSIVFDGNAYNALPIQTIGFDVSSSGEPPKPTLEISNLEGFMTALVLQYDDLVGVKVIRRQVFAKFLDGVPGAEVGETGELPQDIFYIYQKTREDKLTIEFELSSSMDLDGYSLPGRQVISETCTAIYRDEETCPFTETRVVTDKHGNILGNAQGYRQLYSANKVYNNTDDGTDSGTRLRTIDDAVIYEDSIYRCKLNAVQNILPTNTTYWEKVQTYKGEWNEDDTFVVNDVVYTLDIFERKHFHILTAPSVSGSSFKPPNARFWDTDFCNHRLISGCRLRFDPRDERKPLPINAFPGVNRLPVRL